jgi:amino-acid N-acetyltransferase
MSAKPQFAIDISRNPQLSVVSALLQAQALPTEDITEQHMVNFFVARRSAKADSPALGVVGAEIFDSVALLRSLAVRDDVRGFGFGHRLVEYAEACLKQEAVTDLYLLTNTAEPFFIKLGYIKIAKDIAPLEIKQTREFAHLCPDNSALLMKHLI